LIALNEVGCEPDRFGASTAAFHQAMVWRRERQAAGLSATSTHDTKRGEDARARLYALSEMPDAWSSAVERWTGLTAEFQAEGLTVPEPAARWMFYQALVGAWPLELKPDDAEELSTLSARMVQFMLKAVREAKVHTSWTGQDEGYEAAIRAFTEAVLDPSRGEAFLQDFVSFCEPIFVAGALNSLAQTAIKLAAPGVPDIYQGTESWDFSLVDPDNRRAVDFDLRQGQFEQVGSAPVHDLVANWRNGAIKMRMLEAGLSLRNALRKMFSDGDYLPLEAEGPAADHVVSFARLHGQNAVVVVAPRLCLKMLKGQNQPLVPSDLWKDTFIRLPRSLAGRPLNDMLTCRTRAGDILELAEVLDAVPVGVLSTSLPDRCFDPHKFMAKRF
jgi:(1->4)-alpha-D-glucan 1-alpha-D-glucosylmutase